MTDQTTPAKPRHSYVGWELPGSVRDKLLEIFPPLYPDVIAHHVTLKHGVKETYPLPTATSGRIVGTTHDNDRVQALIVEIGGDIYREDFGVYHVTWSIDRAKGAKAFHSNACISNHGFEWIETPIEITLIPMFFPS